MADQPAVFVELVGDVPFAADAVREGLLDLGKVSVRCHGAGDPMAIVECCRAAVTRVQPGTTQPGTAALIVFVLAAGAPGLRDFEGHAAGAVVWAFTRQAALEWAGRDIRVNAVGLGVGPGGPFEATEAAGRASAAVRAAPATLEDVIRTIRGMAAWRSMTGQIIRLGV